MVIITKIFVEKAISHYFLNNGVNLIKKRIEEN
jgi:hypothetical protein